MTTFSRFLKRQDAFGQPVTLNYRGMDHYKTGWGALLTLVHKSFIFVVAIISILDLLDYRDPNITQYKIYDKRTDGTEINFGENNGNFLLGIGKYSSIIPLEAQYGKFAISMMEYRTLADGTQVKEETKISLDKFTEENFPE